MQQNSVHAADISNVITVEHVAACAPYAVQVIDGQGKRSQWLALRVGDSVYLLPDSQAYLKRVNEAPAAIRAAVLHHDTLKRPAASAETAVDILP